MNHQRYGKEPGFHHHRIARRTQESFERLNLPPVAHPLVFAQPETGRKVLNFSPWYATGIDGMAQDEADAILAEITPFCTDDERAYLHRWDRDDMVLWDNWRMLHHAVGVPADETRHVQRTTIHGDYALAAPRRRAGPCRRPERPACHSFLSEGTTGRPPRRGQPSFAFTTGEHGSKMPATVFVWSSASEIIISSVPRRASSAAVARSGSSVSMS